MHQLAGDQVDIARPLFDGASNHLAVQAALAGAIPARIFVDDDKAPQLAVLWARHRLYLAGAPAAANLAMFGAFFNGELAGLARTAGMNALKIHLLDDGWVDAVAALFAGRRFFIGVSQVYQRTTPSRPEPQLWPKTFSLHAVDAQLLAHAELQHLEQLQDEMCSERNSVEEFLDHSFGVCAVQDNALAGWCLSEYNFGGACEVGIETLEPYQRQGLATAMTLAFLDSAAAHGLRTVGWHCWANNVPSAATARKAGFSWVADYPCGVVWLAQNA